MLSKNLLITLLFMLMFAFGTVQAGGDADVPCEEEAPPDSFDPDVQWSWTGAEKQHSVVTPLVANLTDDNDDGLIDLCDVPDVVILANHWESPDHPGHLFVLDGATGALHFEIDFDLNFTVTPALGDLDGDGLVELVAVRNEEPLDFHGAGRLVAFEHDGTFAWEGDSPFDNAWSGAASPFCNNPTERASGWPTPKATPTHRYSDP